MGRLAVYALVLSVACGTSVAPGSTASSSGGGGGATDGGSNTPVGGGDGGIATDAGPPAGSADAGSAGGASDAGATSACDGVVPDLTTPRLTFTPNRGPGTCANGAADGLGNVPLLVTHLDSSGMFTANWLFIDGRTGRAVGEAGFAGTIPYIEDSIPHGMMGLHDGFAALEGQFKGTVESYYLDTFTHAGAQLGHQLVSVRDQRDAQPILLPDPAGGMVLIETQNAATGFNVVLRRFQESGAADGSPVVVATGPASVASPFAEAVVSKTGHILLVHSDGPRPICKAVWLDMRGNKLTQPFTPAECSTHWPGGFLSLVDGSIVTVVADEQVNFHLSSRYADSSTVAEAPPAFLGEDAPPYLFQALPNGRGYAFIPAAPTSDVQFLDASGNVCGKVPLDQLEGPPQIFRDGTMLMHDLRFEGCTFRWWPQLWK